MNYTLEQTGRVLSRLKMGVSTQSAKKLVDNGKLKRVQRPHYCPNTADPFVVCVDSLQNYLINEVGLNANVVYEAVYGTGGNQ
ncbi:hypothetical protein MKY88_19545 [Lysinibacillus sp. FSL R7-0073]|uniref:hypothetical protein n=1 Tax=Lysinibacillus sp. FSL R7-0073 TaxID=2921669 RepID=UPI0030F6A6FE